MLIYIAAPYSAPTEKGRLKNVQKTMDAAIRIYYHGFPFVCPNLLHFLDERAQEIGMPLSWADFMTLDLILLARCDALLYLGESPGTNMEREFALKRGIPVFYSIKELLKTKNGTLLADEEEKLEKEENNGG